MAKSTYRIIVTGSKWPVECTVEATGWRPAIGRAIKEWKTKQKGYRVDELRIRAIKQGPLLVANGGEEES